MLNFIYWPISAVLWFWHKIFGYIFSPDSGAAWLLAIVFLTFTIRIFLVKPMVNQLRSGRKMQELQPKMQEIRAKYGNDQQKQAMEMQRLYKEANMNPLASCIVPLVQMPVFIGLLHVLRSFNRTGTSGGGLGMTVEENRNTANYIFSPEDVQSFLDARVFGVPLSSYMSMPEEQFAAFSPADFSRTDIIIVALPMVIACVLLTHFNARMSMSRQRERMAKRKAEQVAAGKKPEQTGPGSPEMMEMQMKTMNGMMLWFLPATLLFTGFLWHIGLLTYMLSNNVWTFFQTKIVYAKMDKEEEEEEAARREAKRASAPVAGARTVDNRSKKQRQRDAAKQRANNHHPENLPEEAPKDGTTVTKVEPTDTQSDVGLKPKPGAKPDNPKKGKKNKGKNQGKNPNNKQGKKKGN
ncbi:membrane protein insertase YidC [Corynebacterium sp. P3-F1]|uniref:membrane protein insertase YidC n=1 Tax=Corynebacterium sp. P3-F1 TaxID=3059080 RepID=UPI00265CEF4A|nr:membrane protein insertase YidC [Corynebacterium sp. P3-F1]WKK60601.1 membrane protein insertase YidC [Corynebacterium sp. P3-F1]